MILMKAILLLLITTILSSSAEAQGIDNRDCTRLLVVISSSQSSENFQEVMQSFMEAEAICDDMGKDNYDRLLVTIQHVIAIQEEGSDKYNMYIDTLLHYWEKTEEIGYYNESDDLLRGYYYTQMKEPDYEKADFYMSRGIKNQELEDEAYKKLQSATLDSSNFFRYQYQIAAEYLTNGRFHAAHAVAEHVEGELKGKALILQAKAVSATANMCGESTFERKCNYLYAIQLLEEAQELGTGDLSESIQKYRSLSPYGGQTSSFGKINRIHLSCWDVTVEYYE